MKRSDTVTWSQVKVGIFIVCALFFLAWGIILFGEKENLFTPKGRFTVIMTDVAGLKVGAPVWLAGFEIGVVKEIRFEHPEKSNEVQILVEVNREMLKKIGKDSVITVKTRGLIGEKYLDITPSSSVVVKPEKRLYGTSLTRVDEVMQKAGSSFDRLNTVLDKMNRGEGSLGRLATDPKLYDNLAQLSHELATFMGNINRGEGTLGKLAKSHEPYDRLMNILARADQAIQDVQSTKGTMGNLIHNRELYDRLVSVAVKSDKAASDFQELNRKLTSPDGTIGKLIGDRQLYDKGITLMERADRSLASLEEITTRLKQGEGTAGKLLSDKELYDKLNRTVEDLDALVKDIKANPKKYLGVSIF